LIIRDGVLAPHDTWHPQHTKSRRQSRRYGQSDLLYRG
jgi:hypothetical protein